VVWNLEPGQENDYHRHPANEHLTFVIEGELEFTLGERKPETVRPGQLVVIPTNMPHGIRNKSDQRATYVAVTSPGPYEKILVERPA
jgi:quercetin dioxygenase-like cupin family protein